MLILGLPAVSLAVAVVALLRSAPARLRSECDEARRQSLKACEQADLLTTAWQATRNELQSLLDQMADERERATKDRARARSERQRAEQTKAEPVTREDRIAELRRKSGLLNSLQ